MEPGGTIWIVPPSSKALTTVIPLRGTQQASNSDSVRPYMMMHRACALRRDRRMCRELAVVPIT